MSPVKRPIISTDLVLSIQIYAAHHFGGDFTRATNDLLAKAIRCPNLTPDQVAELTGEANKAASDY